MKLLQDRKVYMLAAIAFAIAASGVLAAQSVKTVLDGVYTEAQAARGEIAYNRNCAGCHGETLGVSTHFRSVPYLASLEMSPWFRCFRSHGFLDVR